MQYIHKPAQGVWGRASLSGSIPGWKCFMDKTPRSCLLPPYYSWPKQRRPPFLTMMHPVQGCFQTTWRTAAFRSRQRGTWALEGDQHGGNTHTASPHSLS